MAEPWAIFPEGDGVTHVLSPSSPSPGLSPALAHVPGEPLQPGLCLEPHQPLCYWVKGQGRGWGPVTRLDRAEKVRSGVLKPPASLGTEPTAFQPWNLPLTWSVAGHAFIHSLAHSLILSLIPSLIPLLVHSFNSCLSRTHCVPGSVLSAGDPVDNKHPCAVVSGGDGQRVIRAKTREGAVGEEADHARCIRDPG